MRCCASSTISTVPERPQPDPRSVVEAELFAAALEPLAQSLGFVGEFAVSSVAQQLFAPRASSADA